MGFGRVDMTGQIQESACTIHANDVWQEIAFGTIPQNEVSNPTKNISQLFKFRLINCDIKKNNGDEWLGAEVTFDGDRDLNIENLFSIGGDAKGIAMEITGKNGQLAIPGQALSLLSFSNGENELNYNLKIVPNGMPLINGSWMSAIRFVVAYY